MAKVDLQTLVSSFLRQARKESDPAGFLDDLNAEAVAATMAGDQFVTTTRFDGIESILERKFEATQLLQVTEMALQQLEAEAGLEDGETMPVPGAVRYADFSGAQAQFG